MVKRIFVFFIVLISIAAFTACSKIPAGSEKRPEQGKVIITANTVCFDKSLPDDVKIDLTIQEGDLTKVELNNTELTASGYSFSENKLTIFKEILEAKSTGEYELRIYSVGNSAKIRLLVATRGIYTTSDFQTMNENLTGTYFLNNDLDFSGVSNYVPIGFHYGDDHPDNKLFNGVFDGMGNKISNLKADSGITDISNSAGYIWGIFKYIGASGTVRNLAAENITVKGVGIIGGLAGINLGKISDCFVSAKISSFNGGTQSGLFVGFNGAGGEIKNCISSGVFDLSAYSGARGFCGMNYSIISDCYAQGSLLPQNAVFCDMSSQASLINSAILPDNAFLQTSTLPQYADIFEEWNDSFWKIEQGVFPVLKKLNIA